MEKKRKISKILQDCLNKISPEDKARIDFEMECLADSENNEEDILKVAEEEGLHITPVNKYAIINLCRAFYSKGISDAYNKTIETRK